VTAEGWGANFGSIFGNLERKKSLKGVSSRLSIEGGLPKAIRAPAPDKKRRANSRGRGRSWVLPKGGAQFFVDTIK